MMTLQAIALLFLILYILYDAWKFYERSVSCLFSSEWKSHTVDVLSLADDVDIPRLLGRGYQSIGRRENVSEELRIPAILHQTWKNNDIPEKWKKSHRSCQRRLRGNVLFLLSVHFISKNI